MTVKKKIIASVFVVVLIFLGLQLVMDYVYVLPTIEKLETEAAEKDIKRAVMTVRRELDYLSFLCQSWAEWDDSYRFMKDRNSGFIASNLGEKGFVNNRVTLIFFLDLEGRVVWGKCYSEELGEFISIDEFPEQNWPRDNYLLRHRQRESVLEGYMKTSEGTMMIVARPVVPGSGDGAVRGTLIMGRLFCHNCIDLLRERTQVEMELWPMDSDALTPEACFVKGKLDDKHPTYVDRTGDWIYGYTVFYDFFEKPVLMLRTKAWRTMYKEFVDSFVADIFFHLGAALFVVFLLCFLLQRAIGRPLAHLSKTIAEIKSGGQMKPVDLQVADDEIGQLLHEFNLMAQRLCDEAREREQVESDLRVSEEHLRAVLNAAPDGILTLDSKGIILAANPAAERMFGYPVGGLLGCNILTLADKEQQDLLQEEALKFRQEPENSVFILGVEVTALRADGSNLLIHCKARPIEIRGEKQFICMVRDVSGLKEIHEKLMRTKHLASIGEMGASIAHEIRNPLAGISGAVQVLSDLSSVEKPDYLVLQEIRLLTERIEETVVRMLEYAKDWQLEPRLCRIRELVEDTVAAYNRQAKFKDINIKIVGCKDAKALIDPDLIGQVLVNLIENAVDACNGNGELIWRIEKGLREVSVSVQDNGVGVADEVKENIFKPFFTTKDSGNGLGLAICQKIVEKHNGTISVESKIGVGTKVTIILPQSKFLKA